MTAIRHGKALLRSRTFWLNLAGFLLKTLTAAGIIQLPPGVEDAVLPLLAAENVGNIWLRTQTDCPISGIKSDHA